ncbi:hypothetical protein TRFO_26589 [Tritrichomonas foetus]|uniref:Uncharacterized protein n=1 Tax=Tritrichomonas foetus TaxID=1144522 RepID=A0A1J4K7B5_9EUKA|nr:hypothetical protein TRFO_26589 [Tritrichomonas foetus]|eukprot:OHT05590.1 hypothetical protein TRFO_26589 [Tritrichomonas foetus]
MDVSSIIGLLSSKEGGSNRQQPSNSSNNDIFYNNEQPDEIYNYITYSSGPTQATIQRQQIISNTPKEIDAVSDASGFFQGRRQVNPAANNLSTKNRTQNVQVSPYDFKNSIDVPPEMKVLFSFDSQLQNVSIENMPTIRNLNAIGQVYAFNPKLLGIRSNVKHILPTQSNINTSPQSSESTNASSTNVSSTNTSSTNTSSTNTSSTNTSSTNTSSTNTSSTNTSSKNTSSTNVLSTNTSSTNVLSTNVSLSSPLHETDITKDPYIREIAHTQTEKRLRIFAISRDLAAIAVCQRSILPFDIQLIKEGRNVFVRGGGGLSETHLETVMVPQASIIRERVMAEFTLLSNEASTACEEFSRKAVEGTSVAPLPKPSNQSPAQTNTNPDTAELENSENTFGETEEETDVENIDISCLDGESLIDENAAYVYRLIEFNDMEFIVRGRADCITESSTTSGPRRSGSIRQPSLCLCRAFLDAPSSLRRGGWENLEHRRGTIFLGETNANAAKVARWVANALLAGIDAVMVGYVARKSPSSVSPHVLLGVERHGTEKFAADVSLRVGNMYGVLHSVFGALMVAHSGKYIFVKEARAKRTFHIYGEVKSIYHQGEKVELMNKMESVDVKEKNGDNE